ALAFASNVAVAAGGMALIGIANGPLDLGLFSWRQRATDPAWFGRAFAVSMSLNYLGIPVGAAVAGPIVDRSITTVLLLGAGFALVSAVIPLRGASREVLSTSRGNRPVRRRNAD